ncbi:DUF2975 domain-containing protein [Pedobacter sp.]
MKKLKLLKSLLEISIVGLVVFTIYFVFKLNPWFVKFNDFSERLPQQENFNHLRTMMKILPVLASFKMIIPTVFFLVVLITMRKVLIAIIEDGIFSLKQAKLVKKIAGIYLVLTGILFSFNVLVGIPALILKADNSAALKFLFTTLSSSLSYLLTSLIAYVIAEIFFVGMKLREENEYTI